MTVASSIWPREFAVAPEDAGTRLDVFLAEHLTEFSRATIRRAIDAGNVRVDAAICKASHKLRAGNRVVVDSVDAPREGPKPQAIPLTILHEDDSIIVVDKPAGMIVHPAKGHWEGTLASALAYHFQELSQFGGPTRPGIVHRLDRDTSGVLVIAKNDQVHEALAAQFKDRSTEKEYLAVVVGVPDRDRDIINEPIGDHPTHREKKAIRRDHYSAREATTVYEVLERFSGFAYLKARPKTGRTHQIRIHLAHAGFPVLCDRLYGGRARILEQELVPRDRARENAAPGAVEVGRAVLRRHALHAHRLAITHPARGQRISFEAPLATDIEQTLAALRAWRTLK